MPSTSGALRLERSCQERGFRCGLDAAAAAAGMATLRRPSRWLQTLAACLLATGAAATQQAVLLPAAADPTVATGVPDPNSWGNGLGGIGQGLRAQACFAGSNFLARGVGSAVTIDRLRFRAASFGNAVTMANATVELSTSAVPPSGLQQQWNANHGPDRTVVYSGQIQVQAVPSTIPVGPFHVDLVLTTPFSYDPFAGDLLLDLRLPVAGMQGNGAAPGEVLFGSSQAGRGLFGSLSSPFASTLLSALPVLEVGYSVPGGSASAASYGVGCPDRRATCFEAFDPTTNPFDLGGAVNRVRWTRQAAGYQVDAGSGALATPGAVALPLGDDDCSAPIPLPFAFPFVGTTAVQTAVQIVVASNGFVWLDDMTNDPQPAPYATLLCGGMPRIAAYWADLDPASGGAVHLDSSAASVVVTWAAVPNHFGGGAVTAQLEMFQNGDFELRWGAVTAIQSAIVGFTPGMTLLAASTDLSQAAALPVSGDVLPLQLVSPTRPVLGTTWAPEVRRVPPGSLLGVMIYSTTPVALDLTFLGLDGCSLWAALDLTNVLFPIQDGVSSPIVVPNLPALVGFPVAAQVVVAVTGFNAFGAITSNGVLGVVGSH